MKIAVIGAGISGLTAAYYLSKGGADCQVYEAADRVGGNIRSIRQDGYLFEEGPNSLLFNADHLALIEELGLGGQLLRAADVNKYRYVYRDGAYRKLPSGPDILFNTFFSWKTKLSLLKERNKKNSPSHTPETVADFFRRRFCEEIVDYAVNPFMGGIYAGDPEQLLIDMAFPSLAEAERSHGSIIRGMMAKKGGTKRRATYSFTDGLEQLPLALARKLQVALNTPVEKIVRNEDGTWTLHSALGERTYDRIVLSVPAPVAAKLLEGLAPELAAALLKVNYPPMCCVHSSFARKQVGHNLNGFGGLNPKKEGQFASGSIWTSSIFPTHVPQGQAMLTTFVGGVQNVAQTQLPDAQVLERTTQELQRVFQIAGQPTLQRLSRWEQAIPQYDQEIIPVYALVPTLEKLGLYVSANWKDGVSAVDCIDKGKALSERIFS